MFGPMQYSAVSEDNIQERSILLAVYAKGQQYVQNRWFYLKIDGHSDYNWLSQRFSKLGIKLF